MHLVRWRGFSLPITPPGLCIRHMALSPKVTEISRGKACAKEMDLRMKRWGGRLSQMVEDTRHRLLPSTSLQQSSEPREHGSQPPPTSVLWAEQDKALTSARYSTALLCFNRVILAGTVFKRYMILEGITHLSSLRILLEHTGHSQG